MRTDTEGYGIFTWPWLDKGEPDAAELGDRATAATYGEHADQTRLCNLAMVAGWPTERAESR